jgi:hypothetical protein
MYNPAEVYVNGRFAGIRWQPPFTGDVTDFLVHGQNEIEIKVVNLWPNRLIGDNSLPENERYTRTNVARFTVDYPLRPSGRVGSVTVKLYEVQH